MTVRSLSLDGAWQLRYGPQISHNVDCPLDAQRAEWPLVGATVPGNVELDLMAAGVIADPSVGDAIYDLRAYECHEWWYNRRFSSPEIAGGHTAELVFEGIDCFATVWLNGTCLGETDNMLVAHRFDVTRDLATDGENELIVRIRSSVLEGRMHEVEPCESGHLCGPESLAVRKAPHMYGWDIMPRLVSAGLWRSVRLDVLPPTRWRSVYFTTLAADPARRTANVRIEWNFATERRHIDGLSIRVRLERNAHVAHESVRSVTATHDRLKSLSLNDVDVWWPRGMGEAALHDLTLDLLDETGVVLDSWRERVGVRTVQLVRTDVTSHDSPGEFVFIVNGCKVYCRGTNWVPLDALHARDPRHLNSAMEMLADLNCNMVRCWGGNVYEDHPFFVHCDEKGILVWQDFSLACLIYPQTDAFAEVMRREAEDVVRKLRNHASLALWAGNNEIDMAYGWESLPTDPNTERISREVLPAVVRRLDPWRPYLPSSPYLSPEAFRLRGSRHAMPEEHLWGNRPHYKAPFYTAHPAHFVSEIGYHGCPCRETLEQCLAPEYLWPWRDNAQWGTKATRPFRQGPHYVSRIPLMSQQLAYTFGEVPDTLDDYILASQIAQAEAKKFFVEYYRQAKWRRTGLLWWNLRDGWPIISDAVVDYYNRRKLAYWYIRRSQADVCVICGEPEAGVHPLWVVNDTQSDAGGRVTMCDADTGVVVFDGDFFAPANDRAWIGGVPRTDSQGMWLIEWAVAGATLRNHYLTGEPTYRLDDYKRWLAKLWVEEGGAPIRPI